MASYPMVLAGTLASLAAGLCTGIGALPILVRSSWSERTRVMMLSVAAGVMLGATVFSLIVPALASVQEAGGSELRAVLTVAGGLLLGAIGIWGLHAATPHQHKGKGPEGPGSAKLGKHTLFVLAITLHNLPEGMSVGVAYAADAETGLAVAIGIALQNIPEGFAVAAALLSDGARATRAAGIALLTGLVEPIGGLFGALAVSVSAAALPWGLSIAAGAMMFVISGEVIPETHAAGRERLATLWLVAGFALMMVLDVALG